MQVTNLSAVGIFLMAGVAALPGGTDDPPRRVDATQVRELLEPIRRKHKLPALGAAVVRSRGMEACAVVGVRKHGADIAATDDDCFHLGSDTKPWTALLIAWLIERGLLTWDTPLLDVFPELRRTAADGWQDVTISHLLAHRAGLPANFPGGWWSVKGDDVRAQRVSVVEATVQTAPKAKPGTRYVYSNLGYVVLGAVAERVGKQSWEDLVQKVIAGPLGMKHVGFGPAGSVGKIDQPLPHDGDGEPLEPTAETDNPPVMGPGGRLHCSLPDWSKFIAEHLNGIRGRGVLLKRAAYRRMHDSPYPGKFYALGAWVGKYDTEKRPHRVLAHDGTNTFNYARAVLLTEEDIAVIAATNQGGAAAQEACNEVAGRLLKLAAAR